MLRLLRVEFEKLLHSRVFYASLALFLIYAFVLLFGFRAMMKGFGVAGMGRQSGAMYLYLSFVLSFYPFLVAVAIILAAGAVSSELRAGTLRYSLIAPVARWEYVLAKFIVTVAATAAVLLFLVLTVGGVGTLLLGHGNVMTFDLWAPGKAEPRQPTLLTEEETLRRCLLAVPFVLESAIAAASPAFLISTLVANPVVAITIPLGLFFICSIIQFSPFLLSLKPLLPTRHMFFWDDVFNPDIPWDRILQGVQYHAALIALTLALAVALFVSRDVTA